MRIDFQEVALRGSKSGKCGCGKRRTRSTKVWQTLNPYNTNAAAVPKTREEIIQELRAELVKWRAEPITCDACISQKAA